MIIFLIILAVIIILLNFSITVDLGFYGGEFRLEAKYLFIKLFPRKIKKTKKKEKSEKEKPETEQTYSNVEEIKETVAEAAGAGAKAISKLKKRRLKKKKRKDKITLTDRIPKISENLNKFKLLWEGSQKNIKKLYKCVSIDNLSLNFRVADEDAYEAAMKYGMVSAVTYNALSAVRIFFPVTIDGISIKCAFNEEKSSYDGGLRVKAHTLRLLAVFTFILADFAKVYLKNKSVFKNN